MNLLNALIGAAENRDWRDVARDECTSFLLRLQDMELISSGWRATASGWPQAAGGSNAAFAAGGRWRAYSR